MNFRAINQPLDIVNGYEFSHQKSTFWNCTVLYIWIFALKILNSKFLFWFFILSQGFNLNLWGSLFLARKFKYFINIWNVDFWRESSNIFNIIEQVLFVARKFKYLEMKCSSKLNFWQKKMDFSPVCKLTWSTVFWCIIQLRIQKWRLRRKPCILIAKRQ